MTEKNEENISKLAAAVVDSWDMETLLHYAMMNLEDAYGKDTELFERDWLEMSDIGDV